jgi:peptidoglycan hydrolase-like protein with peptidoglycan-binding domain
MHPLLWVSIPKNRKEPACRILAFRPRLFPDGSQATCERTMPIHRAQSISELKMGRMSGLALALTGTASVCAAFALQSSTPPDDTAALVSDRSDIVKGSRGEGSRGGSGRRLALASDGWRAFRKLVNPSESAETVVVITAPRAKAMVRAPIALATPATPMPRDRESLVRELQRELRRVGCYDGTLNGSWTVSTRSAMKAFTNRVNAGLPTKEPDQILLALVEGHHGRACGTCPNGQSLANDGRCLPNAILAQTRRKAPSQRSKPRLKRVGGSWQGLAEVVNDPPAQEAPRSAGASMTGNDALPPSDGAPMRRVTSCGLRKMRRRRQMGVTLQHPVSGGLVLEGQQISIQIQNRRLTGGVG